MLLMAGKKRRRRRREAGAAVEQKEEEENHHFIVNFIYGGTGGSELDTPLNYLSKSLISIFLLFDFYQSYYNFN